MLHHHNKLRRYDLFVVFFKGSYQGYSTQTRKYIFPLALKLRKCIFILSDYTCTTVYLQHFQGLVQHVVSQTVHQGINHQSQESIREREHFAEAALCLGFWKHRDKNQSPIELDHRSEVRRANRKCLLPPSGGKDSQDSGDNEYVRS